jgi:hypothetical protein
MCKELRETLNLACKLLMPIPIRMVRGLHWQRVDFGEDAMKTTVLMLFVLCAGMCMAQAVLPNQPQIIELPDHPQHAEPHAMASEHPLVGGGPETYTWAHGERPLWEFGPVSVEPSLGDVARAYRKEKMTGKKAEIIFEKQGS